MRLEGGIAMRPRDRVKMAENVEDTPGTVIAVLIDGRIVVAWDDNYIDEEGNLYQPTELEVID